MARIRSVKPELRRDLTVAEWPRECRYAWVLLWGYLDDDGRGLDDLRLLVADLFPLDRDVTERKLDGWLKRMAAPSVHGEPPLCRYQVEGRAFLHAPKWVRSQRVSHPQASRIPPCPVHDAPDSDSRVVPEPVPNQDGVTPESFRPSRTPEGLGVKGAREKEQGSMVPADAAENAQTLVAEWIDHCATRPPGRVVGQVAKEIGQMLGEGLPYDVVRRGLVAWAGKGLHPATLASEVNAQANRQLALVARPSTRDAAVAQVDAAFDAAFARRSPA